jgi:hypothetical protein
MAELSYGPDSPATWSPAALSQKPARDKCRDVRGGTESFRAKRTLYLPRFEAEHPTDWDTRIKMTFVVDFLEQVITTLVGLGLRHDPQLGDDVPPEIASDWETFDVHRNHGAIFAQQALDAALTDGHSFILTDAPSFEGQPNAAEEKALGIRPYAVLVLADQVPSWRHETIGGQVWLTLWVMCESVEMAAGLFGTKTEKRYRVYRQAFGAAGPYVTWELWVEQSVNGASQTVRIGEGVLQGPQQIPVRIVVGGRLIAPLVSIPPLLGVAESNIRWAQVASDRAMSLHKCGVPIPVIIGDLVGDEAGTKSDITASYSRGIHLKGGGDARILEATGTALEQQRIELQDVEKRIAAQSLALLQRDSAAAETATAQRLNRGREESKLARSLRSLEDALEGALQDSASFRGLDSGGSVTIRRDFGDVVSESTLRLFSDLEERGQLTPLRLLTELQRADVLGQDFDPEAEVQALEEGQSLNTSAPPRDPATMTDAEIQAEIARLNGDLLQRVPGQVTT